MIRSLFLCFGSLIIGISVLGILPDCNQRSLNEQLASSFGGDPYKDKVTLNCQDQTPVSNMGNPIYQGCTAVNGKCQQCTTENDDGSFSTAKYDGLKSLTAPISPGKQYQASEVGQPSPTQKCGEYFNGTCITSSTSPTGFSCKGMMSGNDCPQPQVVVDQIVKTDGPAPGPGSTGD